MVTDDMFHFSCQFVTPIEAPLTEQISWYAGCPEARLAIILQTDGYIRFEVYPMSGATALKLVAPTLPKGCHFLVHVRHKNGKTKLRLTDLESDYSVERPCEPDQARNRIRELFVNQ